MNRKKALIIGGAVALVVIVVVIIAVVLNAGAKDSTFAKAPAKEIPAAPEQKPAPSQSPVYPLTGLPVTDESAMSLRPLSVKIENSPEARPQLGFSHADVVYETITEAGITRFNCIFQSDIPAEVGPVRSGRNSDVTLVPQYDALFFMSGANDLVLSQIANAGIADMYHSGAGSIYYRVDYRYAPHNLYLSLGQAHATAESLGFSINADPVRKLNFLDPEAVGAAADAPAATGAATTVTIPFSDSYTAEWVYDAETATYARFMDGATIDVETDGQIAVTNLVVMWASYYPVPGGETLEVDLNGGGVASVFYDGKRFDGTWSSDGANPPRFYDAEGTEIKLSPGKSWFSVQRSDWDIVTS